MYAEARWTDIEHNCYNSKLAVCH